MSGVRTVARLPVGKPQEGSGQRVDGIPADGNPGARTVVGLVVFMDMSVIGSDGPRSAGNVVSSAESGLGDWVHGSVMTL
jgi:hypothetical protein